ncbi:MAG: hypothetical protein ING10_01495 [Roseomonas sp.]|nr:hypothetical protein [Roseomonas sp.]
MRARVFQLAILGPLAFLSACATVTTGTDHAILVESEPAGATCTLRRNDVVIGTVNATPGSILISKSRHDILVTCEKLGHQPTSRAVIAGFQAMTMGNLVLGGVVGLATDLASGAAVTYPENVRVALWPQSFRSAAERSAFYAGQRAETRADFAKRIENARGACGGRLDQNCLQRMRELREEQSESLRLLAERSRNTPINP